MRNVKVNFHPGVEILYKKSAREGGRFVLVGKSLIYHFGCEGKALNEGTFVFQVHNIGMTVPQFIQKIFSLRIKFIP